MGSFSALIEYLVEVTGTTLSASPLTWCIMSHHATLSPTHWLIKISGQFKASLQQLVALSFSNLLFYSTLNGNCLNPTLRIIQTFNNCLPVLCSFGEWDICRPEFKANCMILDGDDAWERSGMNVCMYPIYACYVGGWMTAIIIMLHTWTPKSLVPHWSAPCRLGAWRRLNPSNCWVHYYSWNKLILVSGQWNWVAQMPKQTIPRIMMHEDREWVVVQACGSSSTGCTASRE